MNKNNEVWVFNGENSNFPSAVFSDVVLAKKWIEKHNLSGILTCYPLDMGVYEWAIENEYFKVKKELHKTSSFIGKFSSAYLKHLHIDAKK